MGTPEIDTSDCGDTDNEGPFVIREPLWDSLANGDGKVASNCTL